MNKPEFQKYFLIMSGAIAAGIGAAILTVPGIFYATYGVTLGADPSLLNEIRATGGALLAFGLLMLAGAIFPALRMHSMLIAALAYLPFGLSRVLSVAIDGWPDNGLIAAAALELVVGSIGATILIRNRRTLSARC